MDRRRSISTRVIILKTLQLTCPLLYRHPKSLVRAEQ